MIYTNFYFHLTFEFCTQRLFYSKLLPFYCFLLCMQCESGSFCFTLIFPFRKAFSDTFIQPNECNSKLKMVKIVHLYAIFIVSLALWERNRCEKSEFQMQFILFIWLSLFSISFGIFINVCAICRMYVHVCGQRKCIVVILFLAEQLKYYMELRSVYL